MNLEIKEVTILIEAKDIAQALNFGKYPVLIWDLDSKKGSKINVKYETRMYGTQLAHCTLQSGYQTEDDGVFYISKQATMLKRVYDAQDHLRSAEFANAPVIEPNQEIAVLVVSKEMNVSFVYIMKSGKMDTDCSVVTKLTHVPNK